MKKIYYLLFFFVSTMSLGVFAQPGMNQMDESVIREFIPVSLDETPVPEYDFQRANKLPLTGYLEKSFDVNGETRTAKFYIAATASIRSLFTIITVPEGYKTTEFMVASGWHALTDKNEEGLVLLEPGQNEWGSPEAEQDYINAVIDFYKSNSYFSIFGISYLAGYGKGGTALEAWSATNPLLVISQAYINSDSQKKEYYSQFQNKYMDGKSSGYKPIEVPEEIKIAYNEIPVPTAFINSDLSRVSEAISYWKDVNDTENTRTSKADYFYGGDVFPQSASSNAWATDYTGAISKVITLEADINVINPRLTQTIYGFLSEYISYDNTTAYGNNLAPRKEYGDIGTMIINNELREFMIYVPESAEKLWPDGAPVVFIFAGNSQTDKIFFHNTLWWKVADKEGCILVFPCETYSNSSTSVSHANTAEFYEKLSEYMKAYYPVDVSRFYGSGQSAGSFAVQGFGVTNPEYFAAIASTSGLSYPNSNGPGIGSISAEDASKKMIPNYCIIGQGDIEFMTGTLWDTINNSLDGWAAYYLEANKVGQLGDGSNLKTEGRFETWTWTNPQDFPIFKVGRTMYRAHNCIPSEIPRLWDFLKHWSYNDGVRYYDGVPVK